MKILVVSNMYPTTEKPYFGTFVKSCVDGYLSQGIKVDLSTINGSGLIAYLKFYLSAFIKSAFRKYDFVHVHYVSHSAPPVYLARLFKKFKILLNFHGSDAFPEVYESSLRRKIKKKICQLVLKKTNAAIVPSDYFKEKIIKSYKFDKIIVSPSGGVDRTLFKNKPAAGRVVMFAGRMIKEKGPLIAAKAIKANEALIDKVIMIGDGPELVIVKETLAGINVEYYDMLPREKLAVKMTEIDIFLFPSVREGESLGLVLIEAIFSGCVPLALDNGAVNEILPDLCEIQLVTNLENYDTRLNELLSNTSYLKKYSDLLYRYTRERYSSEEVSKKLIRDIALVS